MAKKANSVDSLNYEEAQSALEEVISKLDVEPVDLEASVAMFERGKALIQRCQVLLDTAELKVRQLEADGSLKSMDET